MPAPSRTPSTFDFISGFFISTGSYLIDKITAYKRKDNIWPGVPRIKTHVLRFCKSHNVRIRELAVQGGGIVVAEVTTETQET